MVSPIYIIAVALGAGFLIPLVAQIGDRERETGLKVAAGLFYLAVVVLVAIPASWLFDLAAGTTAEVFTAGVRPPLSINLRMGLTEAIALTLMNLVGLFSVFAVGASMHRRGGASYVLALMILLGANGLVLTRDLFNAFVFMEILSIGTYGIIALDDTAKQYAAGFKYLIAGGISSVLFLLGTVYLYRLTGTLNIDGMIEAAASGALSPGELSAPVAGGLLAVGAGFIAPFLVFAGLLIELKPFPANGWALDTYEAANPGIAAMIASVNATAIVLLLMKLLPIFPESILIVLTWVGILTFFAANLVGLRQTDSRRMLGYSSVAQIGLISAVLATSAVDGASGTYVLIAAGGLLVNHLLAKAGLFWIAGAMRGTARSLGPVAGIAAVVFGLALVGLPPFPGFWAKWQFVNTLLATERIALLVLVLAGSLFEAIYVLRWIGALIARPAGVADAGGTEYTATEPGAAVQSAPDSQTHESSPQRIAPLVGAALIVGIALASLFGVFTGWYLGLRLGWSLGAEDWLVWSPFFLAAALLTLEWLPSRVKGVLAIAAVAFYVWLAAPLVTGLPMILGAVFAAGTLAALIASLGRRSTSFATYPLYVLAGTSLVGLVMASQPIAFFMLWEFMTIGSYLLIARSSRGRTSGEGPGAPAAAARYIAFSMGAALLIMVGLMLASQASMTMGADAIGLPEIFGADGYVTLPVLDAASPASGLGAWAAGVAPGTRTAVFVLLGLGFLVKTGAIGLHIWLPDSYTEADDEVTVLLSSALSKAGVLGMIVLLAMVGAGSFGAASVAPNIVLGWIGALTALFGALLAVFQEDVKKLLAYSSLSQVGYMILGIALATHLGWLAGVYQAVNHFIFKGLLFLAISGVIMRTGSRYMYQMGGLIKRMPLSFISALMAIIALSGVPPLSGFGGKWLIYGALLESDWYIQAGVAFFASTIAFLYLFRMIYTVFLGQLKDDLREVREAPAALLIPQIILMAVLMLISMYPNVIINPIIEGIEPYLASTVRWDDYTVVTALGYWNGNAVMWVTMGVFILPLAWLVIVMRRPQRVQQFNMVYAAERPERPETTHYAHNFFAPYRKALGFLAAPAIMRGWEYAIGGVAAVAGAVRRLYSGNGQTYALHILMLTVALYLIAGGM
ncbi:MAG TPA: proton-conducting transporter membrane subunit [Spirochaetia bacterium]|nr:proton-conducting transporter membrane subunit [Spirochaetia bacterium]